MDRKEFLKELYIALGRLPEDEKRNAMAYYNEYLDDAGAENEEQALKDLGSVREIAARINAEFAIKDMEAHPKSTAKGLNAVLVVLLAIFASPIAVPISLLFLMFVACFFMVILGVLFTLWGVAVASVVGGICLGVGIFFVSYAVTPGVTLFAVGLGLAAVGFGVLFGIFCFWITKMMIRGVAYLFNKGLNKSKKKTPGSENFVASKEDETIKEEITAEEVFGEDKEEGGKNDE